MKASVQINHYDIRVMIDGLPAVHIPRKKFRGFQAYNDDETMYGIVFYSGKAKIKTEWDRFDKWKEVLKALNKAL